MNSLNFQITNITCDACVKLSSSALKKLPGVKDVKIDKDSGLTVVESESPLVWSDVESALLKVGKSSSLI